MNKMNPKKKRYLTLAVTAFVSIGAAALIIMNQVGVEAGQATGSATSTQISSEEEVSVPPIIATPQESSSASSTFVPSSGASAAAPLTTISKPTSAPPEPTPPASSVLTDKSKKPSYSSKPVVSKKPTSSKPSGGKPGQVYDPVFGWVTVGGDNQETVVSGDWGEGPEVGIMD